MPIFTLALSLLVLSQSAIFVRTAAAHAVAIGFWRMAIAVPVLGLLLLWRGHGPAIRALKPRQWLLFILCGFFLFAHFYTWFLSAQRTSLAHSMILFCTNPLYTAIGAYFFFGERASLRHLLALSLCFTGICFLLSDKGGAATLEGDLLGVACAVLFSAYVLVSKGLRARLDNVPFAFVTYTACLGFFFAAMITIGLPFFDYGPQAWASFAALAFGSTLLGHSLFTYCLHFFHVNLLSISTLVEPVFTAISAYYFFGEPITAAGMLGFGLVGVGILALYFPYLRAKVRKPGMPPGVDP